MNKKWWIKPLEIGLVSLGTIIMIILMLAVQDMNVLGPVSLSFLGIFSTYLGIDLGRMLKATADKPIGRFKAMHFGRYIYAMVIFAGLTLLSYIIQEKTGNPMTAVLSTFGSGTMIMIGFVIAGLGGNKLLTGENVES